MNLLKNVPELRGSVIKKSNQFVRFSEKCFFVGGSMDGLHQK